LEWNLHKECLPKEGWKVLRNLSKMLSGYNAVLSGGTALALHLGHRISMDLDFFTDVEFNTEALISEIRKTKVPLRILSEGKGYLITEVSGIKTSLFTYEYPFIEELCVYKSVRIAGVLDIASMKIIALSQRGTKRDFVDLFFILQELPFHKIAKHMVMRFGPERINPVHIGKSMVYFSDAESHPDPTYVKGKEVSWIKVKDFFRHYVKQLTLDIDSAVKSVKSDE
jgi:predicted nucleotidyltransferase component of viral defense system